MDVSPDSSGSTVHHVGQTQCGPVCDSSQQHASGVCVTRGRPLAVDVDAMSISRKGMYAYAFPPFVMLGRVLEKILTDHPCELILTAPKWPNQSWYARLLELLVDFPLVLPLGKDLLTQPHNHLRHQSLHSVRLHAWRLSSNPSKRKDFLTQLPNKYLEGDASLHELSMTASGESSLVGVVSNRWIHSKSLFRS